MESLHDFSVAHWDHEPLRLTEARSGPRVCDPQPARLMERVADWPGDWKFMGFQLRPKLPQFRRPLREKLIGQDSG